MKKPNRIAYTLYIMIICFMAVVVPSMYANASGKVVASYMVKGTELTTATLLKTKPKGTQGETTTTTTESMKTSQPVQTSQTLPQKAVETKKFDQLAMPSKGEEIAVIKTKTGVVKLKLLSNYAPKAVEIFKNRVMNGFYDGLSFNKLIGNSIVQGGTDTQNTTISTNANYNVDEYNPEIRNYRGAVAIASGDPGSIDQFVIVQAGQSKIDKDTVSYMKSAGETQFPKQVINKYQKIGGAPFLDYHNVIFGQVFSGMEIVDKIAKAEVDDNNMMKKEVKIIKVTIETFKR